MTDPVSALAGRRVLVIGDAMLDTYLRGSSTRLCQEAPVPVVDVGERVDAPGGAANVALNVRALGGDATLVALTGDDPEGLTLRERLGAEGIATSAPSSDPARRTLAKQRVVADEHLLLRVDQGSTTRASAVDERTLVDAISGAWTSADAVVIADYAYGTLTPNVVDAIAALQARRPRTLVVDAKDLTRFRSVGATAVKPNFGQALALLADAVASDDRVAHVADRGERLLEATGARIVAVTLDHDGAIAFERGRPSYRTYAQPRRAATTSGAGDTFAATLAMALASGADTPVALELASAAAAVVVAKEGTAACSAAELRMQASGGRKLVDDADAWLEVHRRRGERVVFTNGCFDLLHRGHVTYLSRAKELGDVLVVGVNSDESVRALKGSGRPINPLEDRMEVLAALSCVDLVIPFGERTPDRLIERVRPDVFVKGGDYTREMLPEAALVERLGGEVRILSYVDDRSTTGLIHRIRDDAEVA